MGKFKQSPRYNVISMRVSDDELSHFQHLASNYKICVSDMMRQAMELYKSTVGTKRPNSSLNSICNG